MVPRLEAMKSARRPGLGDVDGERLQVVRHQRRQRHDLLEVRLDVALQRVDLEFVLVADHFWHLGDTRPRRYGRDVVTSSRRTRVTPWTMMRRLPSGSLNILWMWLAVPTGCRSFCCRIVLGGFALSEHGNHPARRHGFVDQTDGALARHGERHEGLRKQHGVAQRQAPRFPTARVPSTDCDSSDTIVRCDRSCDLPARRVMKLGLAGSNLLSCSPVGRGCRPRHRRGLL